MKKLISILICVILCVNIVFANSEDNVMNMLDKIWISPIENTKILEKIYISNQEEMERKIALYLIAPGYAREKIGISADDEKMKIQLSEIYSVNENEILKVHYIDSNVYAKDYADNHSLRYLISEQYKIFLKGGDRYRKYNEDGSIFDYKKETTVGAYVVDDDSIAYLKNSAKIYEALASRNIESILDIKVLYINSLCTCLYIDCGTNEYLIRIYVGTFTSYDNDKGSYIYGEWVNKFEPYRLYDAKEVFQIISDESDIMNSTKQTFEQEAKELQERGLLYGNEKGLDLLKPLTRIEAATMLLRAMGESTVSTTNAQTFSDVPSSHWGYGAAENAYSLGLIKGIGEDLFAPDDTVTGAQFATMVLRASNYPDFNWEEAMNILIENGIISEEDASTMDFFTRGDMAKIIFESLNKQVF